MKDLLIQLAVMAAHEYEQPELSVVGRSQCLWTPPWLAKLYVDRAAYERAGCPLAVIMATDIEAEMAEVTMRRRSVR